MLIYALLLCAAVSVTYLVQFQAFSHYHQISLGADLLEMVGIPSVNELEFKQGIEVQA